MWNYACGYLLSFSRLHCTARLLSLSVPPAISAQRQVLRQFYAFHKRNDSAAVWIAQTAFYMPHSWSCFTAVIQVLLLLAEQCTQALQGACRSSSSLLSFFARL